MERFILSDSSWYKSRLTLIDLTDTSGRKYSLEPQLHLFTMRPAVYVAL